MRTNWAIAAAASLLLMACGTPPALSISELNRAELHGKRFTVSGSKPLYGIMDPSKALLGAVGGASMEAMGDEFFRVNRIDDPSAAITGHVARELVTAAGVQPLAEGEAGPAEAPLQLHYQSTVLFGPTLVSGGLWTVTFVSTIRLIDAGQIRLNLTCRRTKKESPSVDPTMAQMAADSALALKKVLKGFSDECVREMTRGL